jgi:hypothetical protein
VPGPQHTPPEEMWRWVLYTREHCYLNPCAVQFLLPGSQTWIQETATHERHVILPNLIWNLNDSLSIWKISSWNQDIHPGSTLESSEELLKDTLFLGHSDLDKSDSKGWAKHP